MNRNDLGKSSGAGDAQVGNRPANNARIATPGAISGQSWQSSGAAADFLGLNDDLAPAQPAQQQPVAPMPAPMAAATQADDGSWFFQSEEPPAPEPTRVEEPVDELVAMQARERSFQEAEKSSRKLAPHALALGGLVVVGMLGVAGFTVFRSSKSTPEVAERPVIAPVASAGKTAEPEVVPPSPTETTRVAADDSPTRRTASLAASTPPEINLPSSVLDTFDETSTYDPLDDPEYIQFDPVTGAPAEETVPAIDEMTSTKLVDPPTIEIATPPVASAADSTSTGPIVVIAAESSQGSSTYQSEPTSFEDEQASLDAAVASIDAVATPIADAEPAPVEAFEPTSEMTAPPTSTALARSDVAATTETAPNVVADEPEELATTRRAEELQARAGGALELAALVGTALSLAPRRSPATDRVDGAFESPAPELSALTADAPKPPAAIETAPQAPVALATPPPRAPQSATAVPESTTTPATSAPTIVIAAPRGEAHAPLVISSKSTATPTTGDADASSGLRVATAQDLSGIWQADTVPFEAIGGAKKVLTPNVGPVRVILRDKGIFEGTLYAVGEGNVWIQTDVGRMGLSSTRVQTIERVVAMPTGPGGKPMEEPNLRIKTPGGILVGKILARDDAQTVILTADGSRLTLPTKDVEVVTTTPKLTIKP